jgi:hypothetical protein
VTDKTNTSNPDVLSDLLRRQVEELKQTALQSEGDVPESQIQRVERLNRLADLCAALKKKNSARHQRWNVIELLLGTLSLILLLLLFRKPSVQVELDLTVSGLSFVQARDQQVSDSATLRSLGANSFGSMQVPDTREDPQPMIPSAPINFQTTDNYPRGLTLAPLSLAAGTRFSLERGSAPNQYMLYLEGNTVEVEAIVRGPVLVGAGDARKSRDFGQPKAFQIRGDSVPIELELSIADVQQDVFGPQILVRDVAFGRTLYPVTDGRRTPRLVSALIGGTIYNESLNGRKYDLRRGEWLNFKGSRGEIRSLLLKDDGIHLDFHGWVQGMTTGSEDNRRNLMPSYLEWLNERHGLALLWAAFGWVLAFALGVIRWWHRPLSD